MSPAALSGTLYVVGVGPGDPELMTLKAARIIANAPVIAFFAKRGSVGHARSTVAGWINADAVELRLEYPFTTEIAVDDPRYVPELGAFYECAAAEIAGCLDSGRDVALLCAGDPFFYGSALTLLDRLDGAYASEVIPGVTGMSGCWTRARAPMVHGDDVFTVLPATLDEDQLVERLRACDAAVIMKVGRNLSRAYAAVARAGLMERAIYVEHGTMNGERVVPLEQMNGRAAPYFSLILIPGRQRSR
jgi:precorrin-2/cobalt-factor-2 C20-methyltransferase